MKKTPKNQKSNHLQSSKKSVRAANMKERSFNMESLEPRHLLSGVSFDVVATGTLVEAETFYATVDMALQSVDECYVTMNVADSDGSQAVNAADIRIADNAGNVLTPIKATQNGNVTSLLLKMGMGTDYTVTISNFDQKYEGVYVLFCRPGDTNADGVLSTNEYNVSYGQMLLGLEVNAATTAKYLRQTGVDLTKLTIDPALDMNSNGRFDPNEFMTLIHNNQSDTLLQDISVKPKLNSLTVNGVQAVNLEGTQFVKTEGGNLTIAGTLAHLSGSNQVKVVVTNASGTKLAETTTSSTNFSVNVTGVSSNAALTMVLSYIDKPNTDTTYTIQLDTTAPAPSFSQLDVESFVSKIDYTAEQMGEVAPVAPAYPFSNVSNPAINTMLSGVTEKTPTWELVIVADNNLGSKQEYKRYQFKGTTCTSSTDVISLADGLYKFTWYAVDALGNQTDETAFRSVYIDTTAPDFQIATPEVNRGDSAYITQNKVTPTFSGNAVSESIQFIDNYGGKYVAKDNALLAFTKVYELQHGDNTLSFTIFDDAGNTTQLSRKIISNLIPELSEEGQKLAAKGHVQLATDGTGWAPELKQFFSDDAIDTLTYSATSSNSRIKVKVDADGLLILDYDALKESEISYDSTITVTAVDDYGELVQLVFTAKYTLDDSAPEVTLDLDRFKAEEGVYATNTTEAITLSGNVYDTTGVAEATLYVNGPDGATSSVNLLTGVYTGTLVTSATAMDDNGDFTVTLASNLPEGDYQFTYMSKDTLDHKTEDPVQIAILTVDRTGTDIHITGPEAIAFAGLAAGAQTNAKEVTAAFTLKTDMPECEDARFYIHVLNADKTTKFKVVPVTLTCNDNPLEIPVSLEGLTDSASTFFNFEVRDAAGNLYASFVTNRLVPDWTAPAFTAGLEGEFGTSVKVPSSQYYTEKNSVTVTGLVSSTETVDTTYSVFLNETNIGNPAAGRQDYTLSYGKNELAVYMKDTAGNLSDTQSFIVHYNQAPTVSSEGTTFSSKYFIQDVDDDLKTVELSPLFTDEAMDKMTYTASCDNTKIRTTVKDGVLSFTYQALPYGQASYSGVVTLVATDEYGKSVEMNFTVFYTKDRQAPVVTLDLDAYKSSVDPSVYATNTTESIVLAGNISDATGYKGGMAKLNITGDNGKAAVVDLLNGTYTGDDIISAIVKADNDGNYIVTLIENVPEGTYSFTYDSRDILGNETLGADLNDLIVDRTNTDVVFTEKSVTWSLSSPINVVDNTATLSVKADKAAELYIKMTLTPKDDTAGSVMTSTVFHIFEAGTNTYIENFYSLPEGKVDLNYQILDVAGNVYATVDGDSLIVDLTAPVLDPAQNTLTYQEGTYTKGVKAGEYYTDDATVSIQNLATTPEKLVNYSAVSYVLSLNGAEAAAYTGGDLTLVYGQNTIVLTPVDAAGNVGTSKTFVIHYNEDPELTEKGEKLAEDGFVQNVPKQGEELGTIELAPLFSDEAALSYTVVNKSPALVRATNDNGVLKFTYGQIPDGQISINGDVVVTATDAYGKNVELTFNVLYTYDSEAPKADLSTIQLTSAGQDVNTTVDKENVPFATSKDSFTVSGTVKDTTDILEVKAVIQNSEGTAVAPAQSATFTEKTTSWNFSFDLSSLADGTYTLVVTGKDSLGNDSTPTGTLEAQKIQIVVAQGMPTISTVDANITKTGTSASIVNAAEFNFNSAASDAALLTIYARKAGAASGVEVATIAADSPAQSYNIGNYLTLEDGQSYEVYIVPTNIAGVKGAEKSAASFTMDTTAPVVTVTDYGVSFSTDRYLGFVDFSAVETNKYEVKVCDANDVELSKAEYTGSQSGSFQNLAAAWGSNTYKIYCTDEAGNSINVISKTTVANSAPTVAQTLSAQTFNLSDKTITIAKSTIAGLFSDVDVPFGDSLSYALSLNVMDDYAGLTYTVTEEGSDYVITLNNIPASVRTAPESAVIAEIVVKATDQYSENVSTKANLTRTDLDLIVNPADTDLNGTATQKQKLTSDITYTFDASEHFIDPDGNGFNVTAATVKVNGVENGTVVISGTSLTWTPVDFTYGAATLEITAADTVTARTTSDTVDLKIFWGGASIVASETSSFKADEGAGSVSALLSDSGISYTNTNPAGTVAYSVEVVTSDVHGWQIDAQTGARIAKYTSLFAVDPTLSADGLTLNYTLNDYAYGTASLKLVVTSTLEDGSKVESSQTIPMTINAVANAPYAADAEGQFQLSKDSTSIALVFNAGADEDDENVSVTSFLISSENAYYSEEENLLFVVKGDYEYALTMVYDSATSSYVLTKSGIYDKDTHTLLPEAPAEQWMELAGETVTGAYYVQNSVSTLTNTANLTIEFSSYAKNAYGEGDRAESETEYSWTLDKLCNAGDLTGWTVSAATLRDSSVISTTEKATVSFGDFGVKIDVPAYGYGELIVDFTVAKEGVGEGSGTITLTLNSVNFEPTWAEGVVTTEDGKYIWHEVEDNESETVEYSLDEVSKLFYDYDTPNLTITLAGSVVYDSNGNRVGQLELANDTLTFVPDDPEFSTNEGVTFQLLVTDTAVGTSPANVDVPFTFWLTIEAEDDAPKFKTIPVTRGEIGNEIVIKLSDYVKYVDDVDTPASQISILMVDQGPLTKVDENTYTFTPTEMGSYTFVIKAFDGEKYSEDQDVKIVVGGYQQVTVDDASLDVTLSTTYTIALNKGDKTSSNCTLAEAALATSGSTLKAGFTLKAGSVLCSGTTIPKGVTFSAAPVGLESDAELPEWDPESGSYNDGDSFTLTADWTLNCDMMSAKSSVTTRNLTIKGTAKLAAGSTLIAGTSFSTDTTLYCITEVSPSEAIAKVKKIYEDYQTQTIDVSDALDSNISTVQLIDNTYYEVSEISGTTFTLVLKEGKSFETSEPVTVLLENGTLFSFQVDAAGTYDVATLCGESTLAKATALDDTFASVNIVKDGSTPTDQLLVRYAYTPSSAESGDVQLTLSNGQVLTLNVKNAPVYPFQDLILDVGESTVKSVSFDTLAANSCFKKVEVMDSGTGIRVYYEPYIADQDRSKVTASVELEDGTPITVDISINHETPFTFYTTLSNTYDLTTNNVTELPTSVSSISTEPSTYYLEMWVQCNLPSWQQGLITVIDQYGLTPHMVMTANSEAVSSITALKSSSDFSQQWKVDGVTMDAAAMYALLTGIAGSAADGTYARLGLYEVKTTGEADLTITVTESSKNELSLLFNDDYNIGIYRGGTNYVTEPQMSYSTETTFARPSALRGTQAATETVVEGTGIYMSVAKEASTDEIVAALPESAQYLTEWDSSYVELWLNTQDENVDVSNVNFNLLYNSGLFTATGFEASSLMDGVEFTIDDATGTVSIAGSLKDAVTNADGFVLLGRVKLESGEGDNLAADTVGAVSMGLVLDSIAIQDAAGSLIDPNTQVYVNTKVFAMVYDADDSGTVNLNDLLEFAKLFGTSSIDSTDAKVWAMDFDNSGTINLNDLLAFAKNYSVTKETVGETVYPEGFFQQWIGTTLEATGDSNVADTLDMAIQTWEKALGETLDVDVQIIVKDLDNSEYILGETVLVGLDENGAPDTAIIYLDSNALGMGWYVGESNAVPTEQYDLYSTLLHELGHALGFNASYTGYTSLVSDMYTYTDEDGNSHLLSQDGHSWEYDDLMFPEISTGVRKEVSDLDVEIVSKARANGGEITAQTRYTMTGSIIAEYASGIIPEEAWNAILTSAAEETVAKTTAKALEAYTVEEDSAAVASGAVRSNDTVEDFLEDDEFESLLDEIVGEDLDTTL